MTADNQFHYQDLEKFYNVPGGDRTVFVTMDCDWAPDFVIKYAFNWFFSHGIPFTIFMTHESEYVKSMTSGGLFEVGIHPNFIDAYTEDGPVEGYMDMINDLKKVYPSAIGSRSHRNMCSRTTYDALRGCEIKYDVSKLLWGAKHAEVSPLYCESPRVWNGRNYVTVGGFNNMIEAPYVWEDGVVLGMYLNKNCDSMSPLGIHNTPGLKILNVHPMLFYLNCWHLDDFYKAVRPIKDLTKVSADDISDKVRKVWGPNSQLPGISKHTSTAICNLKDDDFTFHKLSEVMLPAYEQENLR